MFRADAAFAKPEIYEALEERGVKYAIRIPAKDSLERDIAEVLTRPVGRPISTGWLQGSLNGAILEPHPILIYNPSLGLKKGEL